MNEMKMKRLESMLQTKLDELSHNPKQNTSDILLTKSVLEFILLLVDERIDKNNSSLIASEEDIENLSNV